MISIVSTDSHYERILERSTPTFTDAINSVARAFVEGRDTTPAVVRLGDVIGKNMALAQLLGRESAARAVRAVKLVSGHYADNPAERVEKVPFVEAIREICRRTPEVAQFGTPEAVREIVARGGFTLAKSSELKIIDRVLKAQADLTAKSENARDAGKVIAEIGDWNQAYGENIYRTNISRSFSEGRRDQLATEDAKAVIPALRYSAVGDHDTRENHKAADGLVAPVDSGVWARFTPPLGFQCRCGVDFVDRFDYEKMQRTPGFLDAHGVHYPTDFHKAHPDPGFVTGGK